MPAPGEPLFLEEDTAAAIALAEEERDTCPSCGMPKAWCRDGSLTDLGRFEIHEDTCWVTYRQAMHRGDDKWKRKPDDRKHATQVSVRWKKGRQPDIAAGLGFELDALDDADEEGQDQRGDH